MFTEELWNEWSKKENTNYQLSKNPITGKTVKTYLKKGYLHFDPRFWFPERKAEIHSIVSNKNKVAKRAFHPFIKITLKTPRYSLDESTNHRKLSYKNRPICYASHLDSLIYSFYSHCLTKQYENYIHSHNIAECILAYRTDLNASNIDFANEIFQHIKVRGSCTAIALDIKGFFDNLDHKILKEMWAKVIDQTLLPEDQYHIFRSLTEYNYVNQSTLLKHLGINIKKTSQPKSFLAMFPESRDFEKFRRLRSWNIIATNFHTYGIPQGSPMSAVLSNIYLLDYDCKMLQIAKEQGVLYRRYCDDIIFVSDTEKADFIKDIAYTEIEKYKLKIQRKKEEEIVFKMNSKGIIRAFNALKVKKSCDTIDSTNEQVFYKSLQYLGFEFNGQRVYIRSSSMSRYYRKMKGRISKTVKMAYSAHGKGTKLFRAKLLHRYTHLGKRNFTIYARNASSKTYINTNGVEKPGMDSSTIKRQMSRHYRKMEIFLYEKNRRRADYKKKKGKLKRVKK